MERHVERLMRRVQHMVGVGRTTTPVNDTGAAQTVQMQTHSGVHIDNVPIAQHFGFSSVMPVGSDVAFVSVSGDSSAKVAVTTGHQASRQKNTPAGGAVMYDQCGTRRRMSNDGNATLTLTGTFTIEIAGTSFTFSAATLAAIGATVTSDRNIIAGLGTGDQVTLQHHTHPTAALGGPSMPTPGT